MRLISLGLCASLFFACVDGDADSPSIYDMSVAGESLDTSVSGSEVEDVEAGDELGGEEMSVRQVEPPTQLSVASYNLQNLFDFVDDPEHAEGEFTPNVGDWSRSTYEARLNALAEAVLLIDADILALQEVESETALSDLASVIKNKGGRDYQYYATSSSRDPRGIALGILSIYPFDREVGRPISADINCANGEILNGSRPEARPIYEVNFFSDGTGGGEQSLTLLINHWKSRASGDVPCLVGEHHDRGARQIRELLNTWLAESVNRSVLVLGDFNAEESETSLSQTIDAYLNVNELSEFALYNLWGELGVSASSNDNATNSSYRYEGQWFRLDHIMITPGMTGQGNGAWSLDTFTLIRDSSLLWNGGPNSWSNQRQEGYSDHLPIKVKLNLR